MRTASTRRRVAPLTDEKNTTAEADVADAIPDVADDQAETREFTCVQCPMGCPLTVTLVDGKVTGVTGNTCPRGKAYGEHEAVAPERTVTSLVGAEGSTRPVSVKTSAPVPKGRIGDVLTAIEHTVAPAKVAIGDVVITDVAGTGVDVVVTRASDWAGGGL